MNRIPVLGLSAPAKSEQRLQRIRKSTKRCQVLATTSQVGALANRSLYPLSPISRRPSNLPNFPLSLVDSSLGVLGVRKVYQRVGLEDMSTLTSYKQWGKTYGLEFVEFDDQTNNLVMHYDSVRANLTTYISLVDIEYIHCCNV